MKPHPFTLWASENRRLAQVIIVMAQTGIVACGIAAGYQLPDNGNLLQVFFSCLAAILLTLGLGLYFRLSRQRRRLTASSRRVADVSLIAAGFLLATGFGSASPTSVPDNAANLHAAAHTGMHKHPDQSRSSKMEVAIRSLKHNAAAAGHCDACLRQQEDPIEMETTSITPIQAKDIPPRKTHTPDEPLGLELGARIFLFVLATIVAVILAYLVYVLACWVACSGLGVVGLLIWIAGWIILAALLIVLAKALFGKPKSKKNR